MFTDDANLNYYPRFYVAFFKKLHAHITFNYLSDISNCIFYRCLKILYTTESMMFCFQCGHLLWLSLSFFPLPAIFLVIALTGTSNRRNRSCDPGHSWPLLTLIEELLKYHIKYDDSNPADTATYLCNIHYPPPS